MRGNDVARPVDDARALGFNSRSLIAAWVTQRRLADEAHATDHPAGK